MKKAISILTVMATVLLLILFAVLTLTNCKKIDVPKDTPTCIKKEIRKIKSDKVRNPPAIIWQYDYNGQTVYYIPPYCCDIPSQIFDNDCNQICSPDGGLSGAGDGKCPDFFSNRINEKLIWQDDRK